MALDHSALHSSLSCLLFLSFLCFKASSLSLFAFFSSYFWSGCHGYKESFCVTGSKEAECFHWRKNVQLHTWLPLLVYVQAEVQTIIPHCKSHRQAYNMGLFWSSFCLEKSYYVCCDILCVTYCDEATQSFFTAKVTIYPLYLGNGSINMWFTFVIFSEVPLNICSCKDFRRWLLPSAFNWSLEIADCADCSRYFIFTKSTPITECLHNRLLTFILQSKASAVIAAQQEMAFGMIG